MRNGHQATDVPKTILSFHQLFQPIYLSDSIYKTSLHSEPDNIFLYDYYQYFLDSVVPALYLFGRPFTNCKFFA
jgi:hypothetical protein